jgi:MerR family copper efflux transcriptional regulator
MEPPSELLSISAVGRETGLSARTIRYYEELGLLPGVRRREGGRRVYGGDELERLRFIQRLKTLGLSLAEVKELNAVHAIGGSTAAMLRHLESLLERRLGDLDGRIAELMNLRDDIGKYRDHVRTRIEARDAAASGRKLS